MGLDIYLLKLTDNPKSKRDWLSKEDNPELYEYFSHCLKLRVNASKDGNIFIESGYYYDEISYQRKGVKSLFHKRFKSDDFVLTTERLMDLKKCIDKKHKVSFQSNFVEKFYEKENFILLCQ